MRVARLKARNLRLIPDAPLGVGNGAMAIQGDRLIQRISGQVSFVDGSNGLGRGRGTYISAAIKTYSSAPGSYNTNQIQWFPFPAFSPWRTDEIRPFLLTSGSNTYAIGLYSDSNVYPGNLLLQVLDLATVSPAPFPVITVPATEYPRGLYWLAIWCPSGTSASTIPVTSSPPVLGYDPAIASNGIRTNYVSTDIPYAPNTSLPAIAPSGLAIAVGVPAPLILFSSIS